MCINKVLEVSMDINDVLSITRRLENLPEIYDQIERAVYAVVHSYFQDMLNVEKLEAEIMSSPDRDSDELDSHIERMVEIHKKILV